MSWSNLPDVPELCKSEARSKKYVGVEGEREGGGEGGEIPSPGKLFLAAGNAPWFQEHLQQPFWRWEAMREVALGGEKHFRSPASQSVRLPTLIRQAYKRP